MANATHSGQTAADGIHIIHAYEYADAAARVGASGFTAADIGKVARQLDNESFWALTDTTPTWFQFIGVIPATDVDAVHANAAAEILAIAEKTTSVSADLLLVEDSAAAHVKKRLQVGNLPIVGFTGVILVSGSTTSIHVTIGAAIAASVADDLIMVGPGDYAESITIPDDVSLLSTGCCRKTTISGSAATGARVTLGDNSVLRGFRVELPTDASSAIIYSGAAASDISNVMLSGNGASGIGISNTGTGELNIDNVCYCGGTANRVIESSGGKTVIRGSRLGRAPLSLVNFARVSNSSLVLEAAILECLSSVTTCLEINASGRLLGTGVHINDASTAVSVTQTSSVVELRDFHADDCGVDLIVPAGQDPEVKVYAAHMHRDRVFYPLASTNVLLQFVDDFAGDRGFSVQGELAVGRPGCGRESIFGEGDSYVQGMIAKRNTNLEVGTWSTITTELRADDALSAAIFPGVGVGNTFYIGSDHTFPGIKTSTATAIALGAGSLVWEYWDGSAWQSFLIMAADSLGTNPTSYAQDAFGRIAFEQIRWGDAEFTTWTTKAIDGETKYWVRCRVASSITTVPVVSQTKVHSNRTEINANGVIEYFGTAELIQDVGWHQRLMNDLGGAASGNTSVDLTANITVGMVDNRFANGATDGIAAVVPIPVGLDTSRDLILTWTWYGIGTGDVEFETNAGPVKVGDTLDGSLSDVGQSLIQTAAGTEILSKNSFSYDVSALVPGEFLALALFRDASAGNPDDTLAGHVILVTVSITGTFWR